MVKCAIGQDSHAFEQDESGKVISNSLKPLILGGIKIDAPYFLRANSDGDVVLHALTNAISGITTKNILGKIADDMCKSGITDSSEYLKVALSGLVAIGYGIDHVSFTIECQKPHLSAYIDSMRTRIASLCNIDASCVGITATSGEGLTSFGQGLGIQVFCLITCSIK